MPTREAVATALLAKIVATGAFAAHGRRARDPAAIGPGDSPACFLVISGEDFVRVAPNLPAKRRLKFAAFIYNDVGVAPNAIPETGLNVATEALEAALVPDNPATGFCTLGGLVFSAMLIGEARRAPAELTGKALAVVPIEVIVP